MADAQRVEESERIRSWAIKHDLDFSDEQILELANKETFECFARQRRYLQGALQRAKMMAGTEASYPNHNDYLARVEMLYVQEAGMSFCNVTDSWGSPLGKTVDEMAKRCVKAESGSSSKDKLIENLQDRVDDLERLNREGGPGRGNKS
jgi:hypothetical protein